MLFVTFMTSCSSINNLDVSKIIEKTENWIFYKEDNSNEKDVYNENDEEEFREDTVQVEEVFPDINDVPQVQPEFEQIDESFFVDDEREVDNLKVESSIEVNQTSQQNKAKNENVLVGKNITAISEVRKNIRFKLIKLLLDSDPPVDKKQPITKDSTENVQAMKVAIIQFPDNSIIPDNSADKVLNEIVQFKDTKKLRLVGHASKTGSETTEGKRINMDISISRAQTIKNMLINKGYDGNNIEVFGKGDLEPLQEEVKKFGESVNRRVEVFFISK